MNRYFVTGEVYEVINAESPEEALREFINLKGTNEESVVVFDDKGVELLNGVELS